MAHDEMLNGYIQGAQEVIFAMAKANLVPPDARKKLDDWLEQTVRTYKGSYAPPGPPDLRK